MHTNIGIITVRDKHYHPNRRLAQAAAAKGHEVVRVHPYRFWPAHLEPGKATLIQGDVTRLPQVVLPRQGADVGPSCLPLIRHFERMGIPVINGFDAVRISRHQFYTLQALQAAGVPFPESIFVNSADGFYHGIDALGGFPVVVKQVSLRQGVGVIKVTSATQAREVVTCHFETPQKARLGLLVQRYLPATGRQDIRVLVLGQRVAGAQVLTPVAGDFRSNAHLGGQGRAFAISDSIRNLALKATSAVGLEIAGVDIMISQGEPPLVGEVNYAPGFKALEESTGRDIAGEIIDYVVKRV